MIQSWGRRKPGGTSKLAVSKFHAHLKNGTVYRQNRPTTHMRQILQSQLSVSVILHASTVAR